LHRIALLIASGCHFLIALQVMGGLASVARSLSFGKRESKEVNQLTNHDEPVAKRKAKK